MKFTLYTFKKDFEKITTHEVKKEDIPVFLTEVNKLHQWGISHILEQHI